MSISPIAPDVSAMNEAAAAGAALPARFDEALHLFNERKHDDALILCEQILAENRDSSEAVMLLGLIAFELDEPTQAIDLLTRAQDAAPQIRDYTEALASVHARLGDVTEALYLTKLATTLEAHPSGGAILPSGVTGFFDSLESAVPGKFFKRAQRLYSVGNFAGAEAAAKKQLELTPGAPDTLRILAQIWRATGQKTAALAALHAVMHSSPQAADRSALASTLSEAGRHDEAARADRIARQMFPDDPEAARSQLVNLARDPDRDPGEIIAVGRSWFARFARPDSASATAAERPCGENRKGQRFTVGLIGNCINNPEAGHMLAPVMAGLKRRGVRLNVYADEDRHSITRESLAYHADRWTSLKGVDPETAAAILRGDGTDIAIDLSGFGPGCRLATLANRPARLCLAWQGDALVAVHGLDWLLTGPGAMTADAAGIAAWPLPDTPLVYPAPAGLAPPAPLPTSRNGFATIGVAMSLGAIGAQTLGLWHTVLTAFPTARLLVANVDRLDEDCVARAHEQIGHAGLRDRIAIIDLDDSEHVALDFWDHVDIAIDPVPAGSFSRTAQALWKGVPVIAVSGSVSAAPTGATALTAADRAEWIVPDNAAAVHCLATLLGDPEALTATRAALPDSVSRSPLADGNALADALLAAFRAMLVEVDRR